jgi:hypothetical protein
MIGKRPSGKDRRDEELADSITSTSGDDDDGGGDDDGE